MQHMVFRDFYALATDSSRCASQMLVIPPQLSLYMALAPEDKLMYPLGGPSAQSAFESGVNGFESRAFRGLGVFTSTPVRFALAPRLPGLPRLPD